PDIPDYWFVTANDVQTVTHGNSGVFSITAIPLNFTGTINVSSSGVKSITGGKGTWSATSIPGGSGTVTFTVSTTSSTPKGTYPITLSANSGNLTRTLVVSLTVN